MTEAIECCHRTRLRDAKCPAGLVCPHDTAAALARLRAWVRSEAEGADLPEHYPHTFRGQKDVERLVAAVEEMGGDDRHV